MIFFALWKMFPIRTYACKTRVLFISACMVIFIHVIGQRLPSFGLHLYRLCIALYKVHISFSKAIKK
ncbi:hypothetical protein K439DRAFT_166350 [Ramaria rubella]|nr:hypothetical protein K439DRAFT_166350 [Ramaria rubella]